MPLPLQDAEERISQLWGGTRVRLDPNWLQLSSAIAPRVFLARMCTNLKQNYLMSRDVEHALVMARMLRATLPTSTSELRDEGLFLYYLGRYQARP